MYNSGNMFGFNGYDVVKAIAETTETLHHNDDQPESPAQPRPNLIAGLKNRLQPHPVCDGSVPAPADLTRSVQSR